MEYHSLNTLQVYNASTAHVDACSIQNIRVMYLCLKSSISGDLKSNLFSQAGNIPIHEFGTRLFVQLITFTVAVPLQLSMYSFIWILEFDPSD